MIEHIREVTVDTKTDSLWGQAGSPDSTQPSGLNRVGFLEISNTGVAAASGERTARLSLDTIRFGHR